jgi:hypothetical protein
VGPHRGECGGRLRAIEVKSSRPRTSKGLGAFCARWPEAVRLMVGQGGMPLEEFFSADLPTLLQ